MFGSCRSFYKDYYDWFKTNIGQNCARKVVFVFKTRGGIPIQALLTNSMLAFPQNMNRPIKDDLVKLLQYFKIFSIFTQSR